MTDLAAGSPGSTAAATPPAPLPALVLHDWRFSIDAEAIAWAVIDRAGESTNTLGRRVLEELGTIVERVEALAATQAIKGLVFISGKRTGFIAGADVREFDTAGSESDIIEAIGQINGVLDRIENLAVPVVAAIDGFCLGGGLELALACHWRIATRAETTRIGFPEVRLGIFPGFNGTARSIRQAGPLKAMQAMLTGAMLRPTVARAQNLVDELVPDVTHLRWAARKAVLRNRRAAGAGLVQSLLRQWPLRGLIAKQMRARAAEKARPEHYPAPFRLIDLFERHGGSTACLKREETKAFAPLLLSATSVNLRRVFRLMESLKEQAPKDLAKPLRVHVVGAGTMGADIAAWAVQQGLEASLQDLSAEAIKAAQERARKQFQRRYRSRVEVDAAVARLVADPLGVHVPRADIVIEAIVEKLEAKQAVLRQLEPRLKAGAVLATNTSSIPIEAIAGALADPGRLIGIHFFNPVAQMPLVEVVRGPASREADVARGCGFVTAIGKLPLIVKSSPGFLVNRVLGPYMLEAMRRLDGGLDRDTIDEAAKVFGMPMGPLEVADTVGLDVCADVARTLGLDKQDGQGRTLRALVEKGRLGKKTGQGFYKWVDGKPEREPAREAGPGQGRQIEARPPAKSGTAAAPGAASGAAAAPGAKSGGTDPTKSTGVVVPRLTQAQLLKLGEELIAPLIAECEACLRDGVVASADLIDAGVIFGSGFAPFRGGPLHYQRSKGAAAAMAKAAE